jgi:hypothetical protein
MAAGVGALIVAVCVVEGEVDGELPAQRKNLHFNIGGGLSLLHYNQLSYYQ